MALAQIEALEKLLAAATQGEAGSDPFCNLFIGKECVALFDGGNLSPAQDDYNAVYVAALLNAATDLLAAARREIALREWVDHPVWCVRTKDGCTCGLDAILGEEVQP
jgi:hypothetical protein